MTCSQTNSTFSLLEKMKIRLTEATSLFQETQRRNTNGVLRYINRVVMFRLQLWSQASSYCCICRYRKVQEDEIYTASFARQRTLRRCQCLQPLSLPHRATVTAASPYVICMIVEQYNSTPTVLNAFYRLSISFATMRHSSYCIMLLAMSSLLSPLDGNQRVFRSRSTVIPPHEAHVEHTSHGYAMVDTKLISYHPFPSGPHIIVYQSWYALLIRTSRVFIRFVIYMSQTGMMPHPHPHN